MQFFEIKTEQDINNFFDYLHKDLLCCVHPDDGFSDVTDITTKEPTFTPEEAVYLESIMDQCFETAEKLHLDVYEAGMASFERCFPEFKQEF